uniref:Putative secreted peptide n=1 Tax=Anopheles braziliensis TaxID=58242 RepID=A0A2M3ZW49_9DIPT
MSPTASSASFSSFLSASPIWPAGAPFPDVFARCSSFWRSFFFWLSSCFCLRCSFSLRSWARFLRSASTSIALLAM